MKTEPGLFFLLLGLAKDRRARSHRLLARLLRDEAGSWLISMSLMLPVLIGVAGLGTEGGMLFYQHRSLQSAADAAAYSAAIAYSYSTSADITTQAKATVASYGFALGTGTNQANVAATATTFATLPAVQVTISRPQSAIFSSIFFSVLYNSVSATAVLDSSMSGGCVLALGQNPTTGNNDEPSAIQLQGNPTINTRNCGVSTDSTDCTQGSVYVELGGNATINAGSVSSAGCISLSGNSSINLPGGGAYTQNDGALSNPYAGMTIPSSPAPPCVNQPPGSSITISPARYCGLNADHINITLQAGIYILDSNGSSNTTLVVNNATLTDNGAGATLVFTCSTCTSSASPPWPSTMMSVEANGVVSLTAPTTGPTAGFVMMGNPAMPLNTLFDSHSNPNVCLNGTVYAPSGEFEWGGNSN